MRRRLPALLMTSVFALVAGAAIPAANAQTSVDGFVDGLSPAEQTAIGALQAAPEAGPAGSVLVPPVLGLTGIPGFAGSVTDAAVAVPGPVSALVGKAVSQGIGYTFHIEPAVGVTEPTVLERRPITDPAAHGPAELWRVASPAMQRVVDVEVYLPTDGAPSPILYLLDGADSNQPSDFLHYDAGPAQARAAGMTLVVPTTANGSQFTDWVSDDPGLGRNKWETFIARELPPLIESDARVHFNGKRAIAGISMGAGGALRIAARNPGLYRVAAGISGCYGALDDQGFESLRLTVESHGGRIENMWGPRGSREWQEHDLLSRAGGLAGTRVFLSAANGAIGPREARTYGQTPHVMVVGHTLEVQSRGCTERMIGALRGAGIQPTTLLPDSGIHNWTTFGPAISAAVDDMAPVLR